MSSVVEQWDAVRRAVAARAASCGREAGAVRLLAVSKTFPAEAIQAVYRAGQRCFAENKAQELAAKAAQLPDDIQWHFIGHIQTNKAQTVLRYAGWIHSVDSVKLLERLDRLAGEMGKRPVILLEFNLGGEADKTGAAWQDLPALTQAAHQAAHLDWRGLMGMAPLGASEAGVRSAFERLRAERDRLEQQFAITLPELSMGMSQDYPAAIAAGATLVRIGSAIFGDREHSNT